MCIGYILRVEITFVSFYERKVTAESHSDIKSCVMILIKLYKVSSFLECIMLQFPSKNTLKVTMDIFHK